MYKSHIEFLDVIFDIALLEELEEFKMKSEQIAKSYILISSIYKDIKPLSASKELQEILFPLETISLDFESACNIIEATSRNFNSIYKYSQNFGKWFSLKNELLKLKAQILNILEKGLFEIDLQIKEQENPKLANFVNEYQVAQDLFAKKEYEKAIVQARDTFQQDLEENFDMNIKSFENAEEGSIEFYFNSIIKNISEMRNKHLKVTDKSKNHEIKALAKISIEQLINIRNYLEIINKEKQSK